MFTLREIPPARPEPGDAHRRSCIVRFKQSIEGCSSSFASCALAFSSPAILLPFFSLLSYNKTNASFAQQPSSLPSIFFTPHSPVLPKRPKRAPKSSPDAWVLLRFGTCTLIPSDGKIDAQACVRECMLLYSQTHTCTHVFGGRAPDWTSGL